MSQLFPLSRCLSAAARGAQFYDSFASGLKSAVKRVSQLKARSLYASSRGADISPSIESMSIYWNFKSFSKIKAVENRDAPPPSVVNHRLFFSLSLALFIFLSGTLDLTRFSIIPTSKSRSPRSPVALSDKCQPSFCSTNANSHI